MPIGFPAGVAGAGSATALRYIYSGVANVAGSVADAIFFNTLGLFCLSHSTSAGIFFGSNAGGPFEYSATGSASASSTRCTEFNGRLYNVRLGSAVANTVRSTATLVGAWQNEFGGIIINDMASNADKVLLATNYAAGGPNNGVIYTGTTWDNIFSNNAVNALCCEVTPSGRIIFGFAGGIIRYSDDNGVIWNEVNLSVASNVNRIYASGGELVFAGLANGRIFESQDDGTSWADGFPASESTMPVAVIAFGGLGNEVQAYCNSGLITRRIAPLTWRAQPSPTTSNFIGALRKDALHMGFIAQYSVAAL